MIQQHLPLAKTVKPAGAYYYFVDMRDYLTKANRTEEEFAENLLRTTNVAVIPGRFFGDNGIGHVRMTFVSETEERIQLGIEKMARFLLVP
jgi:aspartate aminotransferase